MQGHNASKKRDRDDAFASMFTRDEGDGEYEDFYDGDAFLVEPPATGRRRSPNPPMPSSSASTASSSSASAAAKPSADPRKVASAASRQQGGVASASEAITIPPPVHSIPLAPHVAEDAPLPSGEFPAAVNVAETVFNSLFCSGVVVALDPSAVLCIHPQSGLMMRPPKATPQSSTSLDAPPVFASDAEKDKAALGKYSEANLRLLASGLRRWVSSSSSNAASAPLTKPTYAPVSVAAHLEAASAMHQQQSQWRDLVLPHADKPSWDELAVPGLAGSFRRATASYEAVGSASSAQPIDNAVVPVYNMCNWLQMLFELACSGADLPGNPPRVDPASTLHAVIRIFLSYLTFMERPASDFAISHSTPATEIACFDSGTGAEVRRTIRQLPGDGTTAPCPGVFSLLDCAPWMSTFGKLLAVKDLVESGGDGRVSTVMVTDGLLSFADIAATINNSLDPMVYIASSDMPNFGVLLQRSEYEQLVKPFLNTCIESASRADIEYRFRVYVTSIHDEEAMKLDGSCMLPSTSLITAHPYFVRSALTTVSQWAASNECHSLSSKSGTYIYNACPIGGRVGTLMPIEATVEAWAPFRAYMDERRGEAPSSQSLPPPSCERMGATQNFHRCDLNVILI